MPDGEPEPDAVCTCKVGRTAAAYGLEGLDEELRRRRTDDASLRDLEQFVNEAVLERTVRQAGVDVIGSIESLLDTLTGDDVSAGERTEVRDRLAASGIDTAALEADLVSYQTVRTHLRKCLDIDTGGEVGLTLDDGRGTIEWSRSRNTAIIERTLDRLRRQGQLQTGPVEVSGIVRVTCSDCGATYPVERLVDRGGCACAGRD